MTIVEVSPYEAKAIEPVLELVDCLCTELTLIEAEPCWCGLLPGATVAWDYCTDCGNDHCGMAWVRLAGISPYDVFPEGVIDLRCAKPLAARIEVGVLRCLPMSNDGEPIEAQAMGDVAVRQYLDALAVHRAIQCCPGGNFALGPYVPVGPQGGCVGGFWTAYFDLV